MEPQRIFIQGVIGAMIGATVGWAWSFFVPITNPYWPLILPLGCLLALVLYFALTTVNKRHRERQQK